MKKLLSIIFIVQIIACSDDFERGSLSDDFDFYPVDADFYKIYQVDEIVYDLAGFDTSSYFLRESVRDSFATEDQRSYLLYREIRHPDSSIWSLDSIWSVRLEDRQVVLNAGNLNQVVLSFPVVTGQSWNRNQFNSAAPQTVSYVEVTDALTVPDSVLDGSELIQVSISDIPANLVNQNEQYEIYGKGIGLVEKSAIILDFCTVDCDSAGQIVSGTSLKQTLLSFGYD